MVILCHIEWLCFIKKEKSENSSFIAATEALENNKDLLFSRSSCHKILRGL